MIILQFDNATESKGYFEYIWDGFLLGGSQVARKGIQVLRREFQLLCKLESASEEIDQVLPTGEKRRTIVNPFSLQLDDDEYDMLFGYIQSVPWRTGKPLKEVMSLLNWMESCKLTSLNSVK